ncbi:neuropeptides capa receptor-like isoform X1 [Tachypleus tridentatus]|uniref:neuropeptides capa receptor-like isoform X1 n=1 Tax=Tachypleus tridentatus TaxID=6853 RepID=UPI003FD30EC7
MDEQALLPHINMTEEEYLEANMGPQQITFVVVVPITVVYVLIFVSGIIGNVIVCLVITRNSHFQTPTNYYLFSLAISDLLILLFGIPNDLKLYWQQYPWLLGETVCKLRAMVAEMTSYASVLTIVAFTTERYIAICHPLSIQTLSSLSRAIKIITAVWIVSCISAIPFAIFTKVNYVEYPKGSGNNLEGSAFCALPMESNAVSLPLLQFSIFAFFILPMSLIIILYVKIGLTLRNSRFNRVSSGESSKRSSSGDDSRKLRGRRSVHKMLVAVVIAFFLCWAPFHVQRLLVVYVHREQWTMMLRTLNEVLYYLGGCLYYFSATINPILYSLMSEKYREAFKAALCSSSKETRPRDHSTFRDPRRPSQNTLGPSERHYSIRSERKFSEEGKIAEDKLRTSANETNLLPHRRFSCAQNFVSTENKIPTTSPYNTKEPERDMSVHDDKEAEANEDTFLNNNRNGVSLGLELPVPGESSIQNDITCSHISEYHNGKISHKKFHVRKYGGINIPNILVTKYDSEKCNIEQLPANNRKLSELL